MSLWAPFHRLDSFENVMAATPEAVKEELSASSAVAIQSLLRNQLNERFRLYLDRWSNLELLIGLIVLLLILFATHETRVMAAVAGTAVFLSVFTQFLVLPELVGIGRLLDFGQVLQDAATFQRRYDGNRIAFAVLTGLKLTLVAGLSGSFFYAGDRKRNKFRKKVHAVDDADDSRVDG